jgi:hypothetical protein
MEIKGLRETLGVSDEQFQHLADLRIQAEQKVARMMIHVMRKGGNIHGVDHAATAKRRKANKEAKNSRRINRHS